MHRRAARAGNRRPKTGAKHDRSIRQRLHARGPVPHAGTVPRVSGRQGKRRRGEPGGDGPEAVRRRAWWPTARSCRRRACSTIPSSTCRSSSPKADEIVIGAPYWDLSFPAALKVYIEHVSVCDIAFHYTEDAQCEGHLQGHAPHLPHHLRRLRRGRELRLRVPVRHRQDVRHPRGAVRRRRRAGHRRHRRGRPDGQGPRPNGETRLSKFTAHACAPR